MRAGNGDCIWTLMQNSHAFRSLANIDISKPCKDTDVLCKKLKKNSKQKVFFDKVAPQVKFVFMPVTPASYIVSFYLEKV